MGACATRPGDLKVKGEAPLVLDDAAEKKSGVAETDPAADGTRRRSLSDLLKENTDSDVQAPEAEKKAEPATATADDTGAAEEQLIVQPSIAATDQDHAAEERGAKAAQDPHAHAPVLEEEKRVDPDSVQVAARPAQSVEES